MPRKKSLIDKKIYKLSKGECNICREKIYELLDVHRIKQGSEGGKYSKENSVVVCALCHRKIHAGIIKIDRYYLSTNGQQKLRVFIDDKEFFL